VQMLFKQYNPVNTVVYIVILLLLAFFVVFPFLHRRGIKFNAKFLLALLPYIVFGSGLRVLEDIGLLERSCNPLNAGFYTGTPGIYLMVFLIAVLGLGISKFVGRKMSWSFHKIFAEIGLLFALPVLGVLALDFPEWIAVTGTVFFIAVVVAVVYAIMRVVRKEFWKDKLNLLAVASQSIDGVTTFVATQFYNCGEQHVVSGFVLDAFPFGFVLVKILLILIILYYVDKEIKNPNLRGFIKIFISILGFATGIRDVLTLGAGTCV